MKTDPSSEGKGDLSRSLRPAETDEVVSTRHGKPAGVLNGFESEDDGFEYRLERDPTFQKRIEAARRSIQEGGGVRLGEVDDGST